MNRGPIRRWRERGGRIARIVLPFDDIMEFALALLSVTPAELETLGWTFADRKRLLDHFLASGKVAQGTPPEQLPALPVELAIPQRDVDRLQRFARRELPKAASNAGNARSRAGGAGRRIAPVAGTPHKR
ncbi:hypothetical protein OF829_01955 [Sphingomonas sp. LB-2]|uniref:hypothetical protein n=1 Tax=Sphingomonas caeni TaxID=2984949 RepID=UPI00223003B6|nr:hypothetical protein [Sphingomonas caeni]MCW3845987.1 hypothetical protein [Sphingomonas caeni]